MRKEADFVVSKEGRDRGKTFRLTEMPASKAEKWAMRAAFALAKSNVDLPDLKQGGWAALAYVGFQALSKMQFGDAEPLFEEMMSCVAIVPDRNTPTVTRSLVENDIEEVATRLELRVEVFKLHVNFSTAGDPSPSTTSSTLTGSPSPSTPTSPPSSGPAYRPAKRPK